VTRDEGRGTSKAIPAALLVPLLFFALLPFLLPDRPPLARTGGFGEPTCQQCHFGNPLNDPAGRLTVTGLPDRFVGDSTYLVTLRLTRPGMAKAGFELAVRTSAGSDSGRQAGKLEPTDGKSDVSDTTHAAFGRVQYARHTIFGSNVTSTDSTRWTVKWKAPAKPTGAVVFHVAANAANDDASELSDYIYTAVRTIAPK